MTQDPMERELRATLALLTSAVASRVKDLLRQRGAQLPATATAMGTDEPPLPVEMVATPGEDSRGLLKRGAQFLQEKTQSFLNWLFS